MKTHILIILILLSSCKKVSYHCGMDEDKKVSTNEIARLTNIIDKRGNIAVYNYAISILEKGNMYKELLPIARLMYNKHNYQKASYDIFTAYKNLNGIELSGLTTNEQKTVLKHLLNAHKNGYQNAKNDLEYYSEKKLFFTKKNDEFELID